MEGERLTNICNTAQIILLLISPDFILKDSDYCYGIEMKRAMERHRLKEARVIPIILRPVHWQGALFGKLQALPTCIPHPLSVANGIAEMKPFLILRKVLAK